MTSFLEALLHDIILTSIWEWIAVVTAITYVILVANKHIACWVFALISSAIYVYLCFIGKLYIEAVLSFFYVGMAVFGWIAWNSSSSKSKIQSWKINKHLVNVVLSGIFAFILGYSFDIWTDQAYPYIDAFTTVYSLAATLMIVHKVLENWIYWIIIDLVSVFLYHERGYALSALLFFTYSIIAVIGYLSWRKSYKLQAR